MTQKPSKPFPREFYEQPTLKVAKDLLGKILVKEDANHTIFAKIVDVEAYVGPKDKACHASKGRTKRTEIMFGPAGFTYVYLIYGMYHLLNIVTEREGYPAAILIRGLEILESGSPSPAPTRIDGPGRVGRFLALDRTHNGLDTTQSTAIWVEDRASLCHENRFKPSLASAWTMQVNGPKNSGDSVCQPHFPGIPEQSNPKKYWQNLPSKILNN